LVGREANLIKVWKDLISEHKNILVEMQKLGMSVSAGEIERMKEYDKKIEEALKILGEFK
jgi:transposase-like protein